MVTTRSSSGIKPESRLSNVVLPLPVPPEISTFSFDLISASSSCAIAGVKLWLFTMSVTVSGFTAKRRIDTSGPSIADGGMIALTREPSGRRASTIGVDSSIRRPTRETMRSMIFIRCASS